MQFHRMMGVRAEREPLSFTVGGIILNRQGSN
jgi:hypothetical protein